MGLREQEGRAAQETCVNPGAEYGGPNRQSCLLFATALYLPLLTATSCHSFHLNLLSPMF